MFDNPCVVYRLSDGRIVEPGRLYRLRNGRWAEPWPGACPQCGQRFGPRNMLVGSQAYWCGHVVYTPPVDADCEHPTTRST
ncbi:hypothetical protein [Nocardia araoensis]|uniref:hypothetical protein n=1 Tax=Nocardia araoensis TaxID=228600 RepID=UPI0012F6CB14|nr:hypothetical protein [Nocardia araoensis]